MRVRPGVMLLKFRQKFGKGLKVAWYRDRVRPKILNSQPCRGLTDGFAEVHVLTSSQDWLNLIWTLKSFYRVTDRPYKLAIHEDGSLSMDQIARLREHFPDARIILRKESEQAVLDGLDNHPKAKEFRATNALSLKLFDFPHFLESERMILLDSDVLFYEPPTVLLERIASPEYLKNTVNGDVSGALTVDAETVKKHCQFDLIETFNSGLGLIHRDSLRLDWIEEFLNLPGIIGHFWRIEQTLIALCSCRYGAELLPDEYNVYLDKGLGERPSRHYVGAIRHLMYSEGIRELVKNPYFTS